MTLFRERLLARLVESHAISPELVAKLLAWRHPGFSAFLGEPIAPDEKRRLEDTAAYLVRAPLSLQKLVYLDGEKAVRTPRGRLMPSELVLESTPFRGQRSAWPVHAASRSERVNRRRGPGGCARGVPASTRSPRAAARFVELIASAERY